MFIFFVEKDGAFFSLAIFCVVLPQRHLLSLDLQIWTSSFLMPKNMEYFIPVFIFLCSSSANIGVFYIPEYTMRCFPTPPAKSCLWQFSLENTFLLPKKNFFSQSYQDSFNIYWSCSLSPAVARGVLFAWLSLEQYRGKCSQQLSYQRRSLCNAIFNLKLVFILLLWDEGPVMIEDFW